MMSSLMAAVPNGIIETSKLDHVIVGVVVECALCLR